MKTYLILFFVTVLICLVLCEEYEHSNHKKNQEYDRKEKHSNHHKEKHSNGYTGKKYNNRSFKKHVGKIFENHVGNKLKKSKRAPLSVTVTLNNNGTIRGTVNETNTEKATIYNLFQGIPYAKPPVGDLRFEPPQKFELEGLYDASYQRNICIQNSAPFGFTITGKEDCLYLNVYTPNISNNTQLPVLVWIHGGGFLNGDGNYESRAPDSFVDQNLVVVTLNYRLGVFGFMSTGDSVVPGNMGLKDQLMALTWVQENIVHFGGNPKNITIMGESAGAASVAYLVQSPRSKGLFQQAIAHSGNTLCPWALSRKAKNNFQLLSAKLFIFGDNTTETVRRMKSVDANFLSLISSLSMDTLLLQDALNGLVYAPVVEAPNPTEVFSYKSYEQLDSKNFTVIPMIIGYNSEEGAGFNEVVGLLGFYFLRYDLTPSGLVPLDMNVNDTQTKDKVGREIKETYAGSGTISSNSNATVKFSSHDFFVRPTIKYVELYSKWSQQIYLYRFSYAGNSSQGVPHAGELPYFFYDSSLNASQRAISNKVVNIWSAFIRSGNPSANTVNVTWSPSSQSNNYTYLDIGQEFVNYKQSSNPDKYYLDKWEYWYNTYGHRPYDTY